MADICIENGALLVSDKIHADRIFYGKRHTLAAKRRTRGDVCAPKARFVAWCASFDVQDEGIIRIRPR